MNPTMDRRNSVINNHNSHCVLNEYIDREGLCDIWRLFNPTTERFTWHRKHKDVVLASRIDFFLISTHWADTVKNCDIEIGLYSDHSIISMVLQLSEYPRGPGVWHLNVSHLQDIGYQNGIKEVIETTQKKHSPMNASDLWMQIKRNCAAFSRSYARQKAHNRRNDIHNLKNSYFQLTDELSRAKTKDVHVIMNGLNQIQMKLECYEMEATQQSIFRSKCKYAEDGEKSSKYFFCCGEEMIYGQEYEVHYQ